MLADTFSTELDTSTINLIKSNDYDLDLILPQKVEIQPGRYMLGSKLGWILAGRTSDSVQTKWRKPLLPMSVGFSFVGMY